MFLVELSRVPLYYKVSSVLGIVISLPIALQPLFLRADIRKLSSVCALLPGDSASSQANRYAVVAADPEAPRPAVTLSR